jgi:hypothetical protein
MGSLDGIFEVFVGLGLIIGLAIWGLFSAYNHWFVNHDIKVKKPLIPTIKLVIENNKVDTLYVYKIK